MSELLASALTSIAPASRTRDIGQTELKWIDIPLVARAIVPKIHLAVMSLFSGVTKNNVTTKIMCTSSQELPWLSLLIHLHNAGRLGLLVKHLANLSRMCPPMCYDNPSAACHFVGYTSYLIQEQTPLNGQFVLLSYYDDENILRHLQPLLLSQIKTITHTRYRAHLKTMNKSKFMHRDDPEAIKFLSEYIVVSSMQTDSANASEQLLQRLREHPEGQVALVDSSLLYGPDSWALSPVITFH